MSSMRAIPDSTPTRAQLQLVVLGQWVRAGLDLARGAKAGRGLVGGAVALWQVFQAVRLAILLAQRLSELRDVLSLAAPETEPGETPAQGSVRHADDPPCNAAFLRHALIEISRMIRDALGVGQDRRRLIGADETASAAAEPEAPLALGRPTPPSGRPPDRPPKSERWRSSSAARALKTTLTPLAAPASGRFRLAAG